MYSMNKKTFSDEFSSWRVLRDYICEDFVDFIVPNSKDTHDAGCVLYDLVSEQKVFKIISCTDNPGHYKLEYAVTSKDGKVCREYAYNIYSMDSEDIKTDNHANRHTVFLDVSGCLSKFSEMNGYNEYMGYVERLPREVK